MSRNATLLLRWYGTESSSLLNIAKTTKLVGERWSDEIVPTLAASGRSFRRRSLSSPACSARTRTRMVHNGFLHIPTGKRLSVVIAQVMADHHSEEGRH